MSVYSSCVAMRSPAAGSLARMQHVCQRRCKCACCPACGKQKPDDGTACAHAFSLANRRNKEALYRFTKVFDEGSGQQDVYGAAAAPLVSASSFSLGGSVCGRFQLGVYLCGGIFVWGG